MHYSARVECQLEEAYGELNRYYCSLFYKRCVQDDDVLLKHFIRFGGAKGFAERWMLAMSPDNRWYCSEWYGQEITDERILYQYYMAHRNDGDPPPSAPDGAIC
jgi:hypothetical protein